MTNFGRNDGVMDNAFAQRVATNTLLRLSLFKRPVARWESVNVVLLGALVSFVPAHECCR